MQENDKFQIQENVLFGGGRQGKGAKEGGREEGTGSFNCICKVFCLKRKQEMS